MLVKMSSPKNGKYRYGGSQRRSSSSESDSSREGQRRSSSKTDDEDGGRSTPEERKTEYTRKNNTHSEKSKHERDRSQRHERSRHVNNYSNEKSNSKLHDHRSERTKHKKSERRRSSSSSDEGDRYYEKRRRNRSRSRSRSRESNSKEREPRRYNDFGNVQRSGDRRLFPHMADDRNSASTTSAMSNADSVSWRDGGPLPPPVFIENQAELAPPPPNISGRVPTQEMVPKGQKPTDNAKATHDVSLAQNYKIRSSAVPPYLLMPPHPSSKNKSPPNNAPPLNLSLRPNVPPPLGPPPVAPPALGHRPPPPPNLRPSTSNPFANPKSSELSQDRIINFHEAPKAPKKLPGAKPELKLPPPKLQSGPMKSIALKLNAAPKVKSLGLSQKLPAPVASVFGADDSDSEEEMPVEAKMRMKNVGRETITSSGPNSFGKTRQGFTDTKKLYEKNMHKPLFDGK